MKRWLGAIVFLLLAAGFAFYFFLAPNGRDSPGQVEVSKDQPPLPALDSRPETSAPVQPTPPVAIPQIPSAAVSLPRPDAGSSVSAAPPAELDSVAVPKLPPAVVLENMRSAIQDYGSMFGGNPVGNNSEITSALNGNNPKQAKFIHAEAGLRISPKGELLDPWGTPLFFHQISGSETEIRSAGPDKIMWTTDDLVVK